MAIALGYVISLLFLNASVSLSEKTVLALWQIAPGALLIFGLGLYDDIAGLKARHKLLGQLVAATVTASLGLRITDLSGNGSTAGWTFPLTVLWLVISTNAINLIDGLDGLATGVSILAAATIAGAAMMQGDFALAAVSVPLIGALFGFLRFNGNPASIFLGDCGSLPIGFFLGCYSVMWSQQAASPFSAMLPLLALAVPLADVSLTIARRFLRGYPIFCPDRGHIHHRLLALGHSTKSAAMLLCGAGAFFSSVALFLCASNAQLPCLIATLIIAVCMVRYLKYDEFSIARRTLTVDAFRSRVSSRLLLQALERRLSLASTPDACWIVLRSVYRDFGFHELVFQLDGELRVDRYEAEQSFWRLEIPLSGGNFISLRYGSSLRLHDEVMGGLVSIMRDTLSHASWAETRQAKVPQTLSPMKSGATAGRV